MKPRNKISAKWLLMFFFLPVLTSCGRELDIDALFDQETEDLLISFKTGKLGYVDYEGAKHLAIDSDEFRLLRKWFDDHNGYWLLDDDYSAHQKISIAGSDLQIYIHKTLIRVGYTNDKGYYRQYWASSHLEDFDFLLALNDEVE